MIIEHDTNPKNGTPSTIYGNELYRHESYHYQVVGTRERNGYDDSDFYAIVPQDGRFIEILYGTTRAWTYGNNAIVDAPPSLKEEYKNYTLRAELKRAMIVETQFWTRFTAACQYWLNIPGIDADRLEKLYSESNFSRYILSSLARATRSKFRLSLRDQITAWLLEETPRYDTPLS